MTLYEISDSYRQLLWIAGDPEADPETVQETMDDLDDELEVKADNYVTVIKALETDSDGDKKEIQRLQARVSTRERNIKKMKDALMEAMAAAGKTKLPTEHYKLGIAKNGGKAPLIIDGKVPEKFCDLVPNNEAIRKAIAEGGVDFAHLGDRGEHLSIR